MSKKISIIIPALNEASRLGAAVERTHNASNVERILVDGGSQDGTAQRAESLGLQVLVTSPNRARQMNLGAGAAGGEILLFLHADTLLPAGFDQYVRQALDQDGVVGGAFALHLDRPELSLRIIEKAANWRSRRLQFPYGDQAIFLSAPMFEEIGGFQEIPILEDFDLVRRLRRRGRVITVPASVTTSARRWKQLGIWQTTLTNQAVIVAYLLGVNPGRIARWYYRRRPAPAKGPNC